MGIEHWEPRHADADGLRRGKSTAPTLRRLSVRRTIGRVMEVVEPGDGGEPSFQHLDIELRRDRLDIIRRHHQREPIHGLAPRPERVVALAPDFSESGYRALEGVAVQIRWRGGHDRMTPVPLLR